jgi:hypothetical protein
MQERHKPLPDPQHLRTLRADMGLAQRSQRNKPTRPGS